MGRPEQKRTDRSRSGSGSGQKQDQKRRDEKFLAGIARGFGGALLFSMPILMTMEMWWLGFYAARWKLALFVALMIPMIIVLAYFAGLEEDSGFREIVLDGMTAYAIGILSTVVVLSLLGIVEVTMAPRELIGKIAILSPTAAFGAVLARSQFGAGGKKRREQKKEQSGYWGELFMVAAGAFYVASTVASTQEMVLIPYNMTPWHAAALLVFSVAIMHAFLYTMKFKGAPKEPKGTPWWSIFVRFTMPGYLVALLVTAYLLWTFDRFESFSPYWMAMYTIALGLPGAVGGAAGRLIL